MDLVVAATNREIQPFLCPQDQNGYSTLTVGAGCIESSIALTRFLSSTEGASVKRVFLVGIAGSYLPEIDELDICIATSETLADFGVVVGPEIFDLHFPECPMNQIPLGCALQENFMHYCNEKKNAVHKGPFVTVNGVSGEPKRAEILAQKHQAICENMEGFAVARVCQEFNLPCIEVRVVSNIAGEIGSEHWPIDEACKKLANIFLPFLLL